MTKLFAVLENEESEVVLPEASGQVELLESELAEKEAEIASNEMDEEISIVEESLVSLEELLDVGEVVNKQINEDGVLADDVVKVADVAVESILDRLGYKSPVKTVVAVESYAALTGPDEKNETSKSEASKTTMERITEVVKKIFEGIKNFFKNMLGKLREFLKYLTDSNVRNKSTLNKFKEKISVFKRDRVEPSDKVLDFSKYGQAFNCNDVKDIFMNLAKTLTSHITATKIQNDVNKDLKETVSKIDNEAKIEDIEKLVTLNTGFEITEPMINGDTIVIKNQELTVENKNIKQVDLKSTALVIDDLERICKANDKLIDMNVDVSKNYSGLTKDIEKAVTVLDKLGKVDEKRDWEVETYKRVASALKANIAVVRIYNFFIPRINDQIIKKTNSFIGENLVAYKA